MVSQISFGHVELNHWIPVSSLDIEDMTCLDTMLLEPLAAWSWPMPGSGGSAVLSFFCEVQGGLWISKKTSGTVPTRWTSTSYKWGEVTPINVLING